MSENPNGTGGMVSAASGRLAGVLLILLSAVGFGAMPIFARSAYADGANLYGVLIARFWAAGLLLLALAAWRGAAWPAWGKIAQLAALGGIGYAGMSYCYFAALNYLPAALVALLLYTYPIIVTVLAVLFLHEKVTFLQCCALALCACGTLLVIGADGASAAALSPRGIFLALGAALIYAGYITLGARITRNIDPLRATTVICLAAAGAFTLIALARAQMDLPTRFPATLSGWSGLLGVAILSTVVAVMAFFGGLKRLGAAQAAMLSTLEPVVTLALAAWLLSESLTAWQTLGGATTLAGVLWLASLGQHGQGGEQA